MSHHMRYRHFLALLTIISLPLSALAAGFEAERSTVVTGTMASAQAVPVTSNVSTPSITGRNIDQIATSFKEDRTNGLEILDRILSLLVLPPGHLPGACCCWTVVM